MMANYYEKLTKIFLMSGNALYHAAAWNKYHSVVVTLGGKSEEEISRLCGQVLISALAVPVGHAADESEEVKGKNARLNALLGLTRIPTRSGLLKDAVSSLTFCLDGFSSFPSAIARSSSTPLRPSRRCTTPLKLRLIPVFCAVRLRRFSSLSLPMPIILHTSLSSTAPSSRVSSPSFRKSTPRSSSRTFFRWLRP